MKILNCKIKYNEIIYEVETNKKNNFTYTLPKDTSSFMVRKTLKILESKIDNELEERTTKKVVLENIE